MKRTLFLLCAVALTLAACGDQTAEPPAGAIVVSEPGKIIEVAAGNEFKIVIESNPSTGYHWELVGDLDAALLEFVSKEYRASEPALPGSGGKDVWAFKALAAGEATITLGYFPPAQGEPAAQEVTFTIVVK